MILTIEKKPKFSIKLFHKNLLEVTKHILMNINYEQLCLHHNNPALDITFDFITEKNIEQLHNTSYKLKDLKYICKKNGQLNIGIIAYIGGHAAGMIWGLFPGGADNHYHVKKSDFYIHHGFVFPEYRGNRIYEQLMIAICTEAKQRHNKTDITNITLAVSENNRSALKAYDNMGFKPYSKKTFITIGKWNIPQFHI